MAPRTRWYPVAREVLQPVSQIACFEQRFLGISTPIPRRKPAPNDEDTSRKKPEFISAACATYRRLLQPLLLTSGFMVTEYLKTEALPKFQATVGSKVAFLGG